MLWIIAAVLALLILGVPRFRSLGFGVAGAFAILLIWAMQRSDYGGLLEHSDKRPSQTPTQLPPAPPLSIASVENLRLSGSGAPWQFSGRLMNQSTDYQISSATFAISRADCYPKSGAPDGCLVVWQGKQTLSVAVPPGEARDFVVEIWLHGGPLRTQGTLQDQFKLLSLNGRKVSSENASNR